MTYGFVNMRSVWAGADVIDKSLDIMGRALGEEFDAAVRHVADIAGDSRIALGEAQDGVAEADALDAAVESNPHGSVLRDVH